MYRITFIGRNHQTRTNILHQKYIYTFMYAEIPVRALSCQNLTAATMYLYVYIYLLYYVLYI